MRTEEESIAFPPAAGTLGPIVEELVESLAIQSGEMTVLRATLSRRDAEIAQLLAHIVALEDLNEQLAEEVDELNAEVDALNRDLNEIDSVLVAAVSNVERTLDLVSQQRDDAAWAVPLRLVS